MSVSALGTAFYLALLRLGATLSEGEMLEFASWLGNDAHPMWKAIHGDRKRTDDLWDADERRMIEVLTKVVAGKLATPSDINALKESGSVSDPGI